MEESPSSEMNRFSSSREISPILWNSKVNYRAYKSQPPPLPIPSRINPIHALQSRTFLRSILYQRISPGTRHIYTLHNKTKYYGEDLLSPRPTPLPNWRITPCPLSATAYLICLQLPSIL